MLRIGLVPVLRPLFRGARQGLEERSRKALAALGAEFGFEVVSLSSAVGDAEQARKVAREIQEKADLDFLIVEHITFSTGDLLAPFLDLPLPVGLWALPESSTEGPLPQNSLCGLNLALSLPIARSVPVKWVYGGPEDPWFRKRLHITIQALKGCKALRQARLLSIGGAAPGFYRLEKYDLPVRVEQVPLEALFEAFERIPSREVDGRLHDIQDKGDFPPESLRRMVQLELALERSGEGYAGIALRCWPEIPQRIGTAACGAVACLSDRGYPVACEGDVAGLASMVAISAVTEGPAVLLDLSHFSPEGLMFWHCGNTPQSWSSGKTKFIPHFNLGIPAVRDMRLKPGPVCGLRFLERKGAIVYAGRVQERTDAFDGVSGWISDLRWARIALNGEEFLSTVLNSRLPHHFAWGREDREAALMELCEWLGLRVLMPAPEAETLQWREW